jgi:hypothetical protein
VPNARELELMFTEWAFTDAAAGTRVGVSSPMAMAGSRSTKTCAVLALFIAPIARSIRIRVPLETGFQPKIDRAARLLSRPDVRETA